MLFGVDEECPNHLNIQSLIDIPEQRYYSNLDKYDDPESPHLGPGWELRCSSISARRPPKLVYPTDGPGSLRSLDSDTAIMI